MVVFTLRVQRPRSVVGRCWNLVQDSAGIALLTFIVLKLTGVITWSWWWVLSPMWIGGILLAAVVCAVLVLVVVAAGNAQSMQPIVTALVSCVLNSSAPLGPAVARVHPLPSALRRDRVPVAGDGGL